MASKEQVTSVISDERAYQDRTWDNTTTGRADWLIYLNVYYYDAMHLAGRGKADDEEVLHAIRKVAALCVACMETFGGWDQNSNGMFTTAYPGPIPRRTVYHMIERMRFNKGVGCGSVSEYLLLMGRYVQEGSDRCIGSELAATITQSVLMVGAIAFRCMEEYGAPRRVY